MRHLLSLITILISMSSFADSVNLGLEIKFDVGISHIAYKEDFATVEELLSIQTSYPNSAMTLIGHTDWTGTTEVNQELSEARANTVAEALVKKGGSIEKYLGYGERDPIATNNTKSGRAKNRRVVAIVYGLTSYESKSLIAFAEGSEQLYIVSIENEKVKASLQKMEEAKNLLDSESKVSQGTPDQILEETEKAAFSDVEESVNEKNLKQFEPENNIHKSFTEKATANRYYVGLGVYQNVLDAEDNVGLGAGVEAEWVSKFNFDISGAYQWKLNRNFWFGLEGRFQMQDYEIELDDPYVWDEKNPTLYSLALITDYQKLNWGLGFDMKYGNEPFIFENNDDVTLELSNILSLQLRGKYKVYESLNYSSRVGLSIEQAVYGSGFLEPEGRLGAIAYIDLSKKNWFKHHEINFRLYYGLRNFTNNENDQREALGGLQLRYRNKKWL